MGGLVAKLAPLPWEYKWTTSAQNPSTDLAHTSVKSFPDGNIFNQQITRTVEDSPAVVAKDAVTCETPTYRPVVWRMPTFVNDTTPTFLQTLAAVSGSPTATPILSDFDGSLTPGCYEAEIEAESLPNFGTSLGGGFTQGAAFESGGKVVVLIYALGDKS